MRKTTLLDKVTNPVISDVQCPHCKQYYDISSPADSYAHNNKQCA